MIRSLQRIEFIRPDGTELLLLDIGQHLDAHIPFPIEQRTTTFSPIGAKWSYADAYGGASGQMAWGTIKLFPTIFEALNSCQRHVARVPIGEVGKLRITTRPDVTDDDDDDEVWIYEEATVGSSTPVFYPGLPDAATITAYRATVGRRYPVKGEFSMCDPMDWQTVVMNLDTRPMDDTTCALTGWTPPAPTPGTPPDLLGESEVPAPGSPPDLVEVPTPGIELLGITPSWANGFIPMPPEYQIFPYPFFTRTTVDGTITVTRSFSGEPWRINASTETGELVCEMPAPSRPWRATTWQRDPEDATIDGNPVIRGINLPL